MNFSFNTHSIIKKDEPNSCLITFSTCWYILKSKFDTKIYLNWIRNLLLIVNNFNLVIYTDRESFKQLENILDMSNKKIKIIIKPFEDFYTYRYKDYWIKNHEKSNLNLHSYTDWKLNMLWNEKVFFVNQTILHKYFDTIYYGWCDIGYFRNRVNDLNTLYLSRWPNTNKLITSPFNKDRIHVGCVQNNKQKIVEMSNDIRNHYINKLTSQPYIQIEENCFAGGFFILKHSLINIYVKLYDDKLMYYFISNFIIKDDQTIIMDIIFNNSDLFYVHTEYDIKFDNWFMFQRLLL